MKLIYPLTGKVSVTSYFGSRTDSIEEYGNVKQAREIFEAFARIAEILADF